MRVPPRVQLAITLACIAGFLLYVAKADGATYEPGMSAAAGASVVCLTPPEWRAYVPAAIAAARGVWHAYRISLQEAVCARLRLLQAGRRPNVERRRWELAEAVFVLAHESAHARGIDDERAADCYAARNFRRIAGLLGIGRGYRAELAAFVIVCGGA